MLRLSLLRNCHRAGMDRSERRRLGHRRGEHEPERERDDADERQRPKQELRQAGQEHRADPRLDYSVIQSYLDKSIVSSPSQPWRSAVASPRLDRQGRRAAPRPTRPHREPSGVAETPAPATTCILHGSIGEE